MKYINHQKTRYTYAYKRQAKMQFNFADVDEFVKAYLFTRSNQKL